ARALEKDPERRYESAAAFAEDIVRYLEHRPVLARPHSRWYHATKFARRHRSWMAVSVCITVAAAAGMGAAWRQAQVAREREAEVSGLARASLFETHDEVTAAAALRYLDRLAGEPGRARQAAAGYARLAEIFAVQMGNRAKAREQYQKALAALAAAGGDAGQERAWRLRMEALETK
ncbi:MAG TPA: hypothetical protein DEH78_23965, partial [Solibacterales bacterium]|nr:hypothetical protein [Bryobacterales bacterium]